MAGFRSAGRAPVAATAVACLALSLALSCASGAPSRDDPGTASLAKDYSALGDEYFSLSRFDKAEAAYRKALDLDPGLTIGGYQLARSYAETGSDDKALKLADFLLAKDPSNALFISLKAYILLKTGKAAEARALYASLEEGLPYGPDVMFNMALIDYSDGRTDEATALLKRILSQKPDDADAILLLARVKLGAGDEKGGRLLLGDYLAAKPGDALATRLLARSYVRTQEYGDAIAAWEKLQSGSSADAEVWMESARIYALATEEDDKGVPAFKQALQAGFSDSAAIDAFLASIPAERRADYADALDAHEASLKASPSPAATPGPSPAR